MLEGAIFLDCGTDLRSGHLVPGEETNTILFKLHANFHFCGRWSRTYILVLPHIILRHVLVSRNIAGLGLDKTKLRE